MEFWAKSSQRQAKNSWNDYSTYYEILFTFQAILALLSCKFQGTQATSIITPSPSSLRSPSPTGAQNGKTTIHVSLNRTETALSWTTTVIMSSSLFTPSTAGGKRTSTSLEYNKTVITSRIIALPTMMLSVTHTLAISSVSLRQSNPTTTPSVPTGLPTTVKGLPDVRIIAAIAAILGAILVVLSGIIVWSMCFAHTLERRRSSRVQPSEMGEINRSISQIL
ncbi:hypothetical protein ABFA07_007021 [Porites harrisoni]